MRVVSEGYPFAHVRGETHLVVVNPRREAGSVACPGATVVWGSGVGVSADQVRVEGFGSGVLTL